MKEMDEKQLFLGLGTNLGHRGANLKIGKELLSTGGFEILQSSLSYETPPWGLKEQPSFINQVIEGRYNGTAFELLALAMQVETALGRRRGPHWGPRTLDIDILAFGQQTVNSQRLTVPHPYLAQRAFVLVPWAEIAGDFVVPGYRLSVAQLLEQLSEEEKSVIVPCPDSTGKIP